MMLGHIGLYVGDILRAERQNANLRPGRSRIHPMGRPRQVAALNADESQGPRQRGLRVACHHVLRQDARFRRPHTTAHGGGNVIHGVRNGSGDVGRAAHCHEQHQYGLGAFTRGISLAGGQTRQRIAI